MVIFAFLTLSSCHPHGSLQTVGKLDGGITQRPVGQALAEPAALAIWTEFHQKVEELPAEVRDVVDLLWYQGLSQPEAAQALGVAAITVKRRWAEARLRLGAILQQRDGK